MAEALVRSVIDKFADLVVDEASLLRGVHKEVANIKDELESIQCFLKDADVKAQINDGVKVWVKQMRVVAYQIEDVIDDYIRHLVKTPRNQRSGFINFFRKFGRTIVTLKWRHKIASKIRDINTSLHLVIQRAERYGFKVIVITNQSLSHQTDCVHTKTDHILPITMDTKFRRVFEMFDHDGDGKLTKNEFYGLLVNTGIFMDDTELTELVEKFDVNYDGCVGIDEFGALYRLIMKRRAEEDDLREAFNLFDENGDGFITVEELRSVVVSLGHKQGWTVEDCKKMIMKVDGDGNGMVSFNEFKQMMGGAGVGALS